MVPALSLLFMLWSQGGPHLPDLQLPLLHEGAPGGLCLPWQNRGGKRHLIIKCSGEGRANLGSLSQLPGRALLLLRLFWETTAW